MRKFQVNYSTGQTSRLYQAEVEFLSHALCIKYTDENNALRVINWDIDKINPLKFGASFEPKLTYGDFPFETIEAEESFITELRNFYPQLKHQNKTNSFIQKRTWRTIVITLIAIAGFSALMYLYVVPQVADQVAQSIPVKYEVKMGEKIYHQNMLPFTTDSAKTVLLNNYFQELTIETPYDVQITVVDNTIVNAFAMPGGHIVIFTGLLDKMKHHEELAGVLAHEFAHIHYRHSLRSMARSLANYALISLVIGDASGLAGVIVDNADYIMSLKYSRDMEAQADDYAFDIISERGINPKGMVWLFETLNDLQKDIEVEIDMPEFMRSHPETLKRIEAMKKKLKKIKYTQGNNEALETIWGQIKR